MSVKIQPLADRVVVEPAAAEQKTAGGIMGDNVLYGKYAGTEITIEGKDYLIMRESDLFAII